MSARKINKMRNQGSVQGPTCYPLRIDAVSRKRDERMMREAYRREKKMSSYLAEDENYPSFKNQLAKIGLELRDIPGDGNCLFRALGDQFEGHVRNHFRHRQDVVKYILEHKTEFEPFIADDTTFERHVSALRSLGTYAGNDAIVAFARLHQVTVIIHQLNSPFFVIQGSSIPSPTTRQLHLAYHNGDHYSSVRRIGDNTESPTSIRLKVNGDSSAADLDINDYSGEDGIVRAIRNTQRLTEEVMNATGCTDNEKVLESLKDCDYDVDATIAYVLQTMETMNSAQEDTTSLASQMTSTDSGIWSENGSKAYQTVDINHNGLEVKGHYRENSYGGSSGYGSVSSQNGGARPKLVMGTDIPKHIPEKVEKISNKDKKKMKKMEKKKKAEERHKQRILGVKPPQLVDEPEDVITIVTRDFQMARV